MRMTVQQLIEALQKFDSQKLVVVDGVIILPPSVKKMRKFYL